MTKLNSNNGNETKADIFSWTYSNLTPYHFLKYFNGLSNWNFSVLRLQGAQTIKMKQNQRFFHATYSNLTVHLFSSKNIKACQWLKKSKLVSRLQWTQTDIFLTKSDIFLIRHIQIWHHFSLVREYYNTSMSFIIRIFQFRCKSEHKLIKRNEIEQGMLKSDSIFP